MKLDRDLRERLRSELARRAEEGSLPEPLQSHLGGKRESIPWGLEMSAPAADPGFSGELVTHTVVNLFESPSLLIRNNTFDAPASALWAALLEPHRQRLEEVITAVGRIEVKNHPNRTWIGTGVLLTPDIVVTNRHVARLMATQSAQGWVFASGIASRQIEPRIDFRQEHSVAAVAEFALVDILAIEDASGPDLAFLRVAASTGLPLPVRLASGLPRTDDAVAAIGYTSRVAGMPPEVEALLAGIFGGVFDVKRFAPGRVLRADADFVVHDCSTQGGNSGSALVDIENGDVTGIHFEGGITENFAVSALQVMSRLETLA